MTDVLLHIGYPKCGSTFLQQYFEKHHEIHSHGLDLKEYRETGILPNSLREIALSHNKVVFSEEQLSIHFKPPYHINSFCKQTFIKNQNNTAEQLKIMFPNAKILIVVRKPETLIKSMYSQYVVTGGELSFNDFLDVNLEKNTTCYNYNQLLNTYISFFGRENILILPYELLQNNTEIFFNKIEAFFSISKIHEIPSIQNESISNNLIPLFLILSRIVKFISKFLNENLSKKLYVNYAIFLYYIKEKNTKFKKNDFVIPQTENYTRTINEMKKNSNLLLYFNIDYVS